MTIEKVNMFPKKTLDMEELEAIVNNVMQNRTNLSLPELGFLLMAITGARASEVVNLVFDNVVILSEENTVLCIPDEPERSYSTSEMRDGAAHRYVPLLPELAIPLNEMKKGRNPMDRILSSEDGGYLSEEALIAYGSEYLDQKGFFSKGDQQVLRGS